MLKRLKLNIRSLWPEWTTFFVYCAAVSFAIPYHEPWADEAQAWQLARSLSLSDLFQTHIRYEGSPGLWHFLLWILVRAHVTYTGMHWISGAIAAVAIVLLIFKSPFPRYLRLVLPFTYFLLFQYAVVARSYVLVPCLLFLIALCWKKSPILLAVLLGLLANLALHASVISGGLAVAYFIERVRPGDATEPRDRRKLLLASCFLFCFWAFALWTAWPPKDLADHITSVRGPARPVLLLAVRSLLWAICPSWIASIVFWIAIALTFRHRRCLFYLLPVLFFAIFSGAVHFEWWHAGLLMPLVISLFWITWPIHDGSSSKSESIGRLALLVVATVQILNCAYAIDFDHYNAYSPDLATARFLGPIVQQGGKVAVTYFDSPEVRSSSTTLMDRAIGILPYFDRNIFINQPDSFWSSSSHNPTGQMFYKVLPVQPAVVVVELRTSYSNSPVNSLDPNFELLTKSGYRLTHRFCGVIPLDFRLGYGNCHLVFQRFANQ